MDTKKTKQAWRLVTEPIQLRPGQFYDLDFVRTNYRSGMEIALCLVPDYAPPARRTPTNVRNRIEAWIHVRDSLARSIARNATHGVTYPEDLVTYQRAAARIEDLYRALAGQR